MSNVFLIADTHWGHSNILTFKKADGTNLRTFDSVEHMDEHMIQQWNKTVGHNDKVYHLGDISHPKHLKIMHRLNGDKVLIKGNHDNEKLSKYAEIFRDVRGSHQFDGMILTHIPIHPDSLARWGTNVHGHLHANKVMLPATKFGMVPTKPDPRYYCVSVEQINYTPISLEDLKKDIKIRLEASAKI